MISQLSPAVDEHTAATPPPFLARTLERLRTRRRPPTVRPLRDRRARVPTVLQMEAVECGAAALAMVLGHFGRFVPLEELRVACGVSRDGSKASNIVKAARAYGLEARGLKKEPADLARLAGPVIVHWNFNHFVVVESLNAERAHLNDPSSGPRVVTAEEFDRAFTGIVLTFEPSEGFEPGGQRDATLPALRRRLSGAGVALAFVFLAGLALVVPGLVTPIFSKIYVDSVLVGGMSGWLGPLLLVMATTAFITGVLTWLQQGHLLRLETKFSLSNSSRFFWHVLRLPVGYFTQRYAGDIGARVAINDRIAQLLSGELATTLLNVVMIVFYALLMVQYDPLLTALSVVIAGLNIAALQYASRRRTDLNRRFMQDSGKLLGVTMSGLQTIETMKAGGSEADFFARWSGHEAKVVNGHQDIGVQTLWLGALPPLLLAVNTTLVLGIGGFQVMNGHLSMGMLVAFQALTLAFIMPINRLVDVGATLQEIKGDMARLDDVLSAQTDVELTSAESHPAPASSEVKLTGHLELRGVSFGYSPLDPPLIEGLDLKLAPGSRVALVGGSGCGKTTVARLVCGLYAPWSGEILFDGKPRGSLARSLLHNSFAVVDQDVFLFDGTVRDNLAMWDTTIAEVDLVNAARDACIHDEIAGRANGYGSAVEEGGRNFSGGQRQRLEIARALVRNPSVLVLDEATSALDASAEKAIDDNLRRRGCTCLIVAHRLSTIRDCDEIIVLDKGRIVQRGTHPELMAVTGPYRELIEAA